MRRSFDVNDRDAAMKVLEDLTTNVKQIQDDILEEIVTCNMNTEYLRSFLNGRSDKATFKKNVPVVTYEDVKPYIERVAAGEPSDVISARPITGFALSSGTSRGAPKTFPWNEKHLDDREFLQSLLVFVISKHVDSLEQGKGMMFFFTYTERKTPCGLPVSPSTSKYFNSEIFKNRPSNWYYSYTSPDEVILCSDNKQSLYCHLLCGLVQRDEVVRVGSLYASVLVRAIKLLEGVWEELCSNIRSGHVSEWIIDLACRKSISLVLGRPRPELANDIEHECKKRSWKGIIKRLWPKAKYIDTVVTGSMAQYVSTLEFYCHDLSLISTTYASSESMFGINLVPLSKPQDVTYTLLPNISYFEFLPVEGNNDEIVDLVDVKLGCCYELVVTSSRGLYRIRVGDILQVTGFYNNAPHFKFMRKENIVLSIDMEQTTEEDLLKAVTQAKLVLHSSSDLMLMDFTSYADTCNTRGHYVLYWELRAKNRDGNSKLDPRLLEKCCTAVEESLHPLYKRYRREDGYIGALEIRVVREETFDSLMDFFISRGASLGQYKTPRCLSYARALEELEKRVVGRFFSEKGPCWDSALC